MLRICTVCLLVIFVRSGGVVAQDAGFRFEAQVLSSTVAIGYGLAVGDVDGDGKPDIILVDREEIAWFRNGDWSRFVMAEKMTQRDNVCIAARDLDGDGRVEVAVGGQWNPGETVDPAKSGSVHFLVRPGDPTQPWEPVALHHEPTVHRMAWVRVAPGRHNLVVVPLHGRGNRGGKGDGVRVLAYEPPRGYRGSWKTTLIDDALHMTHNFDVVGGTDNGAEGLLIGGREGVRSHRPDGDGKWRGTASGSWHIRNAGVGEVRRGRLGARVLTATVEPMHGNQVVAHVFDAGGEKKQRHALATDLRQGHALACADFLGIGRDQVVVGWRNPNDDKRVGIRLYVPSKDGASWSRHTIDDNTMACEDLKVADLNGDGRPDVVAAGRSTHNLVIYWNRSAK